MTDKCDLCGRFMSDDREQVDFCDACDAVICAEELEYETGIGHGEVYFSTKYHCRHGYSK